MQLPVDPSLEPHLDDDPVRVLLEETDPHRRCRAHLVLGRRAVERDDPDTALEHFREAVALDPTDERARSQLRKLGADPRRRRSVLDFFRRRS